MLRIIQRIFCLEFDIHFMAGRDRHMLGVY